MSFNSNKQRLIDIFEDTKKWYTTDQKLKEAVEQSQAAVHIYKFDEYPDISSVENRENTVKVTVTRNRTFEAAYKVIVLEPDKKVLVHNFASATNPGGGVERGCSTQEESLCRCSTLYPTLDTEFAWQEYYNYHRKRHDLLYTDTCIYSPNIKIIKADTMNAKRLPEEEWGTVDVITCAAPNLREAAATTSDKTVFELHKKRARHMFTIAASQGVDVIILGAFGCGAFKNKPEIVARAYKDIIEEFKYKFDKIEFAVYCKATETTNYNTFNRLLGNLYK